MRSKFANKHTSIDEVMKSRTTQRDVKIWRLHISLKNAGIDLNFACLIKAIFCINPCEFSLVISWFTTIPLCTGRRLTPMMSLTTSYDLMQMTWSLKSFSTQRNLYLLCSLLTRSTDYMKNQNEGRIYTKLR